MWSVDLALNPGTGALLQTANTFTNTFVGTLIDRDGSPGVDPENPSPAPLFSSPNGIYLMADVLPVGGSVSNFFINVMGREPNNGEQVITLSGTSTYMFGNWSSAQNINVGQSAFINVGPTGTFDPYAVIPVPEPSAMSLLLLGIILLAQRSRRRATAPPR